MRSDFPARALRHFMKFAEAVTAALLAALFLTFVLQIFSRYVLNDPFGWTVELCLTLWVWLIFWGNAFVVGHHEHVSFDMIHLAASARGRRVFSLISAAAIATGMAVSLFPTWDYINFMQIQKSATLRIPLRTVFSVYAIFIVAVGIAYAWRFITLWRNKMAESESHP